MRYSVLIGSLIVIILGYSIYWFVVANETQEAVESWVRMAPAQGLEAGIDEVAVRGYPFRIIARIDGLTLGFPNLEKPLQWDSERMRIVAEPWGGERFLVFLAGDQTFTITEGSRPQRYRLTSDQTRASIIIGNGDMQRFSLALDAPEFDSLGDGRRLAARDVEIHVQKAAAAQPGTAAPETVPSLPHTADVAFRIRGVTLPETIGATLGRTINLIQGRAEVHGQMAGPFPGALQRWAAAGGTMDVTGLKIEWGPLTLEAAGTVTLDEQSRPLGAFKARAKGMKSLIDSLEATGDLDPEYARLARTALSAISEQTQNDRITVPLTLQNGFLYMGPIPLAVLSPVERL